MEKNLILMVNFFQGIPKELEQAYDLLARMDMDFLYDFYRELILQNGLYQASKSAYVPDVIVKERIAPGIKGRFYMNFSREPRTIDGKVLEGYGLRIEETQT